MPRIVKKARIACLDMNLQKARMLMGVQVLFQLNPPSQSTRIPLPVSRPKKLDQLTWSPKGALGAVGLSDCRSTSLIGAS